MGEHFEHALSDEVSEGVVREVELEIYAFAVGRWNFAVGRWKSFDIHFILF